MNRLGYFDVAIQHFAENNLNFTDSPSQNPVGGATLEDNYIEEDVINILTEQTNGSVKYGTVFVDQLDNSERKIKKWYI